MYKISTTLIKKKLNQIIKTKKLSCYLKYNPCAEPFGIS